MMYDVDQIEAMTAYKLMTGTITPRPIAWVTTQDEGGRVNAAPYSFFNGLGPNPPTIAIGMQRDPAKGFKDTPENIMATGEFVVNLVPRKLAEAMNMTAINAPQDVSEVDLAGLETVPSAKVAPPRIAGVPVAFECKLLAGVVTGPKQLAVIGQILAFQIEDDMLLDAERAHVDTQKLDLIARLQGPGWYLDKTGLFEMQRPVYGKDAK